METTDWFNFRNLAWSGEFPAGNFPASGRRIRESSSQCHTLLALRCHHQHAGTHRLGSGNVLLVTENLSSRYSHLSLHPSPWDTSAFTLIHVHAHTHTHSHTCRFNPTITNSKEQEWEPWLKISLGPDQFF